MPPTRICIVARPMRIADRATVIATVLLLVVSVTTGCDQLDGRSRNRKGNAAFRETRFVDAVANYQAALTEVNDPIIHYNLALAYSKVFRAGAEGDVLIDVAGSPACAVIPKVKTVNKQVCIKTGDKHFVDCDEKNVCPSSSKCEKTDLCALDNGQLADLVTEHFGTWLKTHPSDAETRALMTQTWLDASQYKKALDYWQDLLNQKPNDREIMGNLAGINLKAGDWRASINWYLKVVSISTDVSAKVAALQFIGNVAWSKLNSKSLSAPDSVELADRGIGALQQAFVLQPDNFRVLGLQASIFNFRGQAQGASWAGALDRATAQDLQHQTRVLREKAKPAGTAVPGAAPTPTPQAPGASAGGPAKSGG